MSFETEQPPTSAVPPMTSGDLQPLEPPKSWPTVVGVFGIIFASLGIFGGLCGVLGALMGPVFTGMVPEEQRAEMEAQMALSNPYPALNAGYQLVEMVLAIVLLIGSIQLLRRSHKAPGLLKGYAWGDLVANLIGSGLAVVTGLAQIEKLKADPNLPQGGLVGTAMIIFAVVGFVIAAIWPVFLLIWFNRRKIRDDVAGWGDSSMGAMI